MTRMPASQTDRSSARPRVIIVGGGLAGLSAALDLVDGGADVTLLEAGDRFGGQVRTTRERGFLVEEGADGFAPEQLALRGLVRDLRLDDELLIPEDLPTLVLERRNGSRAFRTPPEPVAGAVSAITMRHGMSALVRAMTRRLEGRADLRVGSAAVALEQSGTQMMVYPELGPALVADAVVLALPARAAAWLLHPIQAECARALASLNARSLIVTSVAYRRGDVAHPLDAAGFLVPHTPGDEGLEACAFVTSTMAQRAPADAVLLRALLRPARGELASTTDEGWVRAAHTILSPVLGLGAEPVAAWVARWTDAIPMIDAEYKHLLAEAVGELARLGRLALAGAAFGDPGLDGALRSGREAAHRLLSA